MWRYCKHGVDKTFATTEEFVDYIKRMDAQTEYNSRYWYVENYFDPDDLIDAVADCRFKDVTTDDLLDDALDALEWEFKENEREEDDDLFGVYYKEE
jgi:hypothetical protein